MLEFLDKAVDALHLARNVNLLRAMSYALVAFGAMICLSKLWHAAVVADKEGATRFRVVLRLLTLRHVASIYTFIIMYEDAWDVETIRAWHTVLAVVTINRGVALDERRCFSFEPLLLFFGQRFKR